MPTDTKPLLEELRFAKQQQWAVAIATITLMAGAYHIVNTVKAPLGPWEKHLVTFFVLAVALGGSYLVYRLQRHLRDTRKRIDPDDPNPWRGLYVVIPLMGALIISAIAVCYSFWRA